MPVPRRPLPLFFSEPFTAETVSETPARLRPEPGEGRVSTTSTLLAAGATPSRLRGRDLAAPGRGIRTPAGRTPARLDLLHALRELCADGLVVSHDTAAWMWGMWLPRRLERETSVHLSAPAGSASRPRRRGVVGHRLAEAAETVQCAGLEVTSPAWTWTDLAARLVPWGRPEKVPPAVEERALEDLLVAGESLLQTPYGAAGRREPGEHPRCTVGELEEAVRRRRRVRGARLLREAVPLLRVGSGSPAETRLRRRLVAAGCPEPEMNVRLVLPDGTWIMPDLVWRTWRICLEYEGDHHRVDMEQFRADIRRVRRLEAAGWLCLRVTADVWTEAGMQVLLTDLEQAFARRGAAW